MRPTQFQEGKHNLIFAVAERSSLPAIRLRIDRPDVAESMSYSPETPLEKGQMICPYMALLSAQFDLGD